MSDFSADDFSLPSWAYTDPEFLALERERVFRPSWQVICHVSEIPNPGDYQCFDFIGEMLFAMRGNDGVVRAFHNVCRHRASRLLDGPRGHCTRRIVCPYHAWSYDFEGRLASVGDRTAFPDLDIARESLVPVETEIYAGFVFARIQGGGPTVAQMMAPYADEIATHQFEKLEPIGRVTLRPRKVNWKNVGDNYSDGLHITGGASGSHAVVWRQLPRRVARVDRPHVGRAQRHSLRATGRNACTRSTCRPPSTCRQAERRSWVYFKLWPNFAFDVYPDQVDIMQWLPVSPTEMPDPRDRLRAARRPARDARGALLQLAHQPAGQRGRPRAHRARAERHGVGQLPRRAAGRRRSGAAQLRQAHAHADPGMQRAGAAGRGLVASRHGAELSS